LEFDKYSPGEEAGLEGEEKRKETYGRQEEDITGKSGGMEFFYGCLLVLLIPNTWP